MRLDIKRKLLARSERVKCVDLHPTEPWILASLYDGRVHVWNYSTQALVKTFEVTDLPVRAAKFIARKESIIAAADDMFLRVFNYNTMSKVKTIEAHTDYIRSLAVHPSKSFVLSCSDDMLIKLWDWDKNWQNTMCFEGHSHYVMMVSINPKDPNTFATASLDKTVKVWGFSSPTPHFTLEGHTRGVNSVEFYYGGDKPFLISGADDFNAKVWDFQTKACVATLEGHTHNISSVSFHPEIPIICTGSEDGSVRIWNANTYRLEKTLNYGLDRIWSIGTLKGSHALAIGYDEGCVCIKLGKEEPSVSMDPSGKIVWAKHTDVVFMNLKNVVNEDTVDGERIPLGTKDLGTCEIFPKKLIHNSNGRFVAVCGDGEYIIYTALAWRNKSYGSALEFCWSNEAGGYATREALTKIKIFRNFTEHKNFRTEFSVSHIFGGHLLCIHGPSYIMFYDWNANLIRRVDVMAKKILWNGNGDLLAIVTPDSFYILKFNKQMVEELISSGAPMSEDEAGYEQAFDVLNEMDSSVKDGIWVGDCFVYVNANNRLNYCLGGEVVTIAHLDHSYFLLGYLAKDSRVYLTDKSVDIVSYKLTLSLINYQSAILRGDFETAAEILPEVPGSHIDRVAQFLESQGLLQLALEVSKDPEQKFQLACQLGLHDVAFSLAEEAGEEAKWKQLADIALETSSSFEFVETCLLKARDFSGCLLLYTSAGNRDKLAELGALAKNYGRNNIAFICYFLLHQLDDCLEVLVSTSRIPEAAFFARTYVPSAVSRIVQLWREDLATINEKAAQSLADPMEYGNLFPDLQWALKAEEFLKSEERNNGFLPASAFAEMKDQLMNRNPIEEVKSAENPKDIIPEDIPDE